MAIFSERIALLIDASTGGAVQPLGQLERQAKKTDDAFDRMGKKIGVTGATLKQGLVSAASIGSVISLGAELGKMTEQFASNVKAADDLAAATGSSVETVSRLQAALSDAGVSAEQSAGLLTKFTTAASSGKGAKALADLNVTLTQGKNGAVDYAATMVRAVDAIGQLGDASERNRQLVTLFGKQGAKAFQDLLNSGMSFAEAAAEISGQRIFSEEDARNAQAYDAAMDALNITMQQVTITVGRTFIPTVNDASQGINVLTSAIDLVPQSLLTMGAALASPAIGALTLLGKLFGDDEEAVDGFVASLSGIRTVTAETAAGLSALGTAVEGLNAEFIAAEDAGDQASKGLESWNEALKKGKGLDDERKAALREAVEAQAAYLDALVKSGASAREVQDANEGWAESLYASAKAAGVSKRDVDKYLESLGFIPDKVVTKAILDSLSAEDDLKTLQRKIDALPNDVHIPVYIKAIIQNPGAFNKIERLVAGNRSVVAPVPELMPMSAVSPMGTYLASTVVAIPTQQVVTQNFNIEVSGAGSPAITAREVDRYIRRAGDPRLMSVTA